MLGNMWIEGHSTFVPDSDYDLNGRDDDLYGGALWRRWQSIEERQVVRVWTRGVAGESSSMQIEALVGENSDGATQIDDTSG